MVVSNDAGGSLREAMRIVWVTILKPLSLLNAAQQQEERYCNLVSAAASAQLDEVWPGKDTGQQTRVKRELTMKSRAGGGRFGSFSSCRESRLALRTSGRLTAWPCKAGYRAGAYHNRPGGSVTYHDQKFVRASEPGPWTKPDGRDKLPQSTLQLLILLLYQIFFCACILERVLSCILFSRDICRLSRHQGISYLSTLHFRVFSADQAIVR
ncbi:hypothetical protein KCV06_g47, partial [Aureobasidium melanogenum]